MFQSSLLSKCAISEIRCLWNRAESNFSTAEAKEPQQKLLKVAVLGRTNVGKSTLINQILRLNVCDVSKKINTTLFPVKAALTSENTQIVFIDTPGLMSQSEISKLPVKPKIGNWNSVLQHADVIAVMEELISFKYKMAFSELVLQYLQDLSKKRKTLILVINKVDQLKSKPLLLEVVDYAMSLQKERVKFDRFFFISARNNEGVADITSYLLDAAKEGDWILSKDLVCDTPLDELIIRLLRAEILNLVSKETPYRYKYKINFLEVNTLGDLMCEVSIICPKKRHYDILLSARINFKDISKKIESHIYKIIKKTIRLRINTVVEMKS